MTTEFMYGTGSLGKALRASALTQKLLGELAGPVEIRVRGLTLVNLEAEQEELFERLVEATRGRVRDEREEFMVVRTAGSAFVKGNGIGLEVLYSDVTVLADRRLLGITNRHRSGTGFNCYVTPEGFAFYEGLKTAVGEQTEQVEGEAMRYLEARRFRDGYPNAFARWNEAAHLLWAAESERELSTIGHKCREAVQEFVTTLLERENITDANPDRAMTRDRLSSVLTAKRKRIGRTHRELLDALFSYWVAACDLVQRQEHAGQREGEPLTWEDGRRVVFQTAMVMFEVDRSLT